MGRGSEAYRPQHALAFHEEREAAWMRCEGLSGGCSSSSALAASRSLWYLRREATAVETLQRMPILRASGALMTVLAMVPTPPIQLLTPPGYLPRVQRRRMDVEASWRQPTSRHLAPPGLLVVGENAALLSQAMVSTATRGDTASTRTWTTPAGGTGMSGSGCRRGR